jgi:digeranylgeranylglycerophospholipid reductase
MKTVSDAAVIGGGPCGSFAAYNLARLGFVVTVFEEHHEIGVPSHCPGHLSIKGLKSLGQYPLGKGIIENTFTGANLCSPSGKEFSVHLSSPVTCTVDRASFDRHLAEMAEHAGAHYQLGSRVDSLIVKDGYVKGVAVRQNGNTEEFLARLVIDAEGVSSRLLKQTRLNALDRSMVVNAVQARIRNVKNMESNMVEVFLGNDYAPGFYAWLIPENDDEAKIGLAARTGNPRELLQRFILKHPTASKKLTSAKLSQMVFHPITLGGPIPKSFSNGFLAVGDAASQVKPTTGGGVIFGMSCAKIAADVASEALRANDVSSRSLRQYQKRWTNVWGFDVKTMLRMRKLLNRMSDKTMDNAINLCRRVGLNKALEGVQEIDFQGQSLLHFMRSPRMLTTLGYFLYLYLSINP